jgi:hypothetical protein
MMSIDWSSWFSFRFPADTWRSFNAIKGIDPTPRAIYTFLIARSQVHYSFSLKIFTAPLIDLSVRMSTCTQLSFHSRSILVTGRIIIKSTIYLLMSKTYLRNKILNILCPRNEMPKSKLCRPQRLVVWIPTLSPLPINALSIILMERFTFHL